MAKSDFENAVVELVVRMSLMRVWCGTCLKTLPNPNAEPREFFVLPDDVSSIDVCPFCGKEVE